MSYSCKCNARCMKADSKYEIQIPRKFGAQIKILILYRIVMASCQAITAEGTGYRGSGIFYVNGIECIVFTEFCAIHAESAAFVNIHPERIYVLKEVYQGSDRAVHNTMNHLFPFQRKQEHHSYSNYAKGKGKNS